MGAQEGIAQRGSLYGLGASVMDKEPDADGWCASHIFCPAGNVAVALHPIQANAPSACLLIANTYQRQLLNQGTA